MWSVRLHISEGEPTYPQMHSHLAKKEDML